MAKLTRVVTLNELRAELSQTLRDLRNKEGTPQTANAVCNVAGKILSSVKLEMEYSRLLGHTPSIDMMLSGPKQDAKAPQLPKLSPHA